jgi:serine/threonine protein kinase
MEKEPDLEKDSIIDNKYIIIQKIGEGAYSKVYLVQDINDKQKYAAKILLKSNPQKEKSNFLNEISILGILKKSISINKYVTLYHDSGEGQITKVKDGEITKENRQYLISNYLSKGNLFSYLQKTERGFQEKHAKIIFSKILEGVQYIHNSDICHLDIKLDNILLDAHYNPVITDFGVSRIMEKIGENEYKNFDDKKGIGTPYFMSPQMWLKKGFNGIKADIFSLGVVLFYLITKKNCFIMAHKGEPTYKLICNPKKHEEFWKKIFKIYPQVSHVSDEFRNLYLKMVSYEEENRPKSVKDILDNPIFKDITNLKNEDYTEYENMMKDLENKVDEDNEIFENKPKKLYNQLDNGLKSDENEEMEKFFDSDIGPDYLYKSGFNAMNYIKIKGKLEPVKFMNSLANKLKQEFHCKINPNNKKLKFEALFPNKINDEIENEEDIEEEEEENENIDNYEFKDCVIKIKFLEFINGGYEVHFIKTKGDFMDYYSYFQDIKKIIKKILQ